MTSIRKLKKVTICPGGIKKRQEGEVAKHAQPKEKVDEQKRFSFENQGRGTRENKRGFSAEAEEREEGKHQAEEAKKDELCRLSTGSSRKGEKIEEARMTLQDRVRPSELSSCTSKKGNF